MKVAYAAACLLSIPAAVVAQDRPRDPRDLNFAEAMVAAELRDPQSARFLNIRFVTDHLICGSVNTKNGRGGYVGNLQFAVLAKPLVSDLDSISVSQYAFLFDTVIIGQTPRLRNAVSELCRNK